MIIHVKNFFSLDPKVLKEKIESSLAKGKSVTLDFNTLETCTYEFLESSIGQIIEEHSFESLQNVLHFRNVDVGVKEMILKMVQGNKK